MKDKTNGGKNEKGFIEYGDGDDAIGGIMRPRIKKEFIKRCRNTPVNILMKNSLIRQRIAKDSILFVNEMEYKMYESYRSRMQTDE